MTTAIGNFIWSTAGGAAAQAAWMGGVNSLLLSAGLQQTTDTGQLVTPTSSGLTATANLYGYQIFKFPDTLQSTTPIFLRVEYRSMAAGNPTMLFSVGGATDGAGTLTGPTFTAGTLVSPSSYNATTAVPSYACYTDGTFACVLGYGVNGGPGAVTSTCLTNIVIDRPRSSTGVAQSDGFLCEAGNVNAVTMSRSIFGSSPPVTSAMIPALIPSLSATGSADSTSVNVFRHYMMVPGVRPSLGALSYFYGEFTPLTPITVTVLGASHTYLPMGRAMGGWSATSQQIASGNPQDHAGMIRWE